MKTLLLFTLLVVGCPAAHAEPVQYWLLVKTFGGEQSGRVDATGPYPTKELCRAAAHSMDVDNTTFWSPEEITDAKRHHDQHEADSAKAATEADGWHKFATGNFLVKKHEVVMAEGSLYPYGARIVMSPTFSVIGDCRVVRPEEGGIPK